MQMNWNQEELEQWAVAAKQKEEDNLALEKYKRADEQKIKELSFELEQLAKDLLVHKSKFENEGMETQAKQMELDRIAIEFKNAHLERQALVTRWQETMSEMKKRDKEINEIGESFAKVKQDKIIREGQAALQRKRLQLQVTENREIETKFDTLSRIALKKREEMLLGTSKLNEFRSELDSLKNELTTAAEDIVSQRARTTHLAQNLEVKKVQLERERQKYKVVKGKLELAKSNTNKAELNAKQVEDELSKREKEFITELNRTKILKEKSLKESQLAYELKQEETRLRSEISGNKLILRNLESQLHQLDKDAARQQELLYNAEFQIQQIERKIARGMGERSEEEKSSLKKSIEIAENALNDIKEKKKILLSQSRKLLNELAMYKLKKDDLNTKLFAFSQGLVEKELQNKLIEEEIKHDNKDLEEMTVSNDLLRLEVRRLRDLLSAKSDAVFSLENRKEQLLLSLQERKQEISVHADVLKGELKALNEDKHNLTIDLRKREANVERLKARFDAVARQPDEEKYSQAYFIIRAAQKKEELQRKGDELDQEVRKCEREIRALNITLEHLNTRNVAYRESFQKVDIKGDDIEILKQLEDRTKVNKENLFRKKKELQRLNTDFDEDSRRYEQLNQQTEKIKNQQTHLTIAKTQVQEEIDTQIIQNYELFERIQKISLKHRNKVLESGIDQFSIRNGTLEEKSVKAEVLKDVIQNVLYTLSQLSIEFPEVSETLALRLQEADLKLPTKPPSRSLQSNNYNNNHNNNAYNNSGRFNNDNKNSLPIPPNNGY